MRASTTQLPAAGIEDSMGYNREISDKVLTEGKVACGFTHDTLIGHLVAQTDIQMSNSTNIKIFFLLVIRPLSPISQHRIAMQIVSITHASEKLIHSTMVGLSFSYIRRTIV